MDKPEKVKKEFKEQDFMTDYEAKIRFEPKRMVPVFFIWGRCTRTGRWVLCESNTTSENMLKEKIDKFHERFPMIKVTTQFVNAPKGVDLSVTDNKATLDELLGNSIEDTNFQTEFTLTKK